MDANLHVFLSGSTIVGHQRFAWFFQGPLACLQEVGIISIWVCLEKGVSQNGGVPLFSFQSNSKNGTKPAKGTAPTCCLCPPRFHVFGPISMLRALRRMRFRLVFQGWFPGSNGATGFMQQGSAFRGALRRGSFLCWQLVSFWSAGAPRHGLGCNRIASESGGVLC